MRRFIKPILLLQILTLVFALGYGLFVNTVEYKSYLDQISQNDDYCHTDKDAAEHRKTKECQGLIYKTFDDPVAFFTGGLFAFTIALAVATIRLFQVTKAGIREQADSTREAVTHASRSADAAIASGRAHIRIIDVVHVGTQNVIDFIPDFDGEIPVFIIRVNFSVKNFGATPSDIIGVRVGVSVDRRRHNPAEDCFYPREPWTLGSGDEDSTGPHRLPIEVDRDTSFQIADRQTTLWLHLEIFHTDVFGQKRIEDITWRYASRTGGGRRDFILSSSNRREDN